MTARSVHFFLQCHAVFRKNVANNRLALPPDLPLVSCFLLRTVMDISGLQLVV